MAKTKPKAPPVELFKRTADQWRVIRGNDNGSFADVYATYPFLGISALVRYGAATAEEREMIRRVAAGEAEHDQLTLDHARRILADHPETAL